MKECGKVQSTENEIINVCKSKHIIDVNNVSTYPKFLIDIFKNYDGNEVNYDKVFENCYFRCHHVCCTSTEKNYKKYGILRPYYVNKDGTRGINNKLKNIILEPLKGEKCYDFYSKKYDELLVEEYENNKNLILDWYGKYSCVCYTLDDIVKINRNNPNYEPVISCYGGELFRRIGISDKEAEVIGKNYKSYIVVFKLSYNELKVKIICSDELFNYMIDMYNNKHPKKQFENNVNKDVPPEDIIGMIEIKKNNEY